MQNCFTILSHGICTQPSCAIFLWSYLRFIGYPRYFYPHHSGFFYRHQGNPAAKKVIKQEQDKKKQFTTHPMCCAVNFFPANSSIDQTYTIWWKMSPPYLCDDACFRSPDEWTFHRNGIAYTRVLCKIRLE